MHWPDFHQNFPFWYSCFPQSVVLNLFFFRTRAKISRITYFYAVWSEAVLLMWLVFILFITFRMYWAVTKDVCSVPNAVLHCKIQRGLKCGCSQSGGWERQAIIVFVRFCNRGLWRVLRLAWRRKKLIFPSQNRAVSWKKTDFKLDFAKWVDFDRNWGKSISKKKICQSMEAKKHIVYNEEVRAEGPMRDGD